MSKSTAGTNGLNKVAEYTYDYRYLLVCRKANVKNEYFEYTPEGVLIYDGRPSPNSERDYVYANGSVWCELTGAENIFYHHTDYLGTTEYMTDSSGTVVWQCEYEAFGKVIKKSGSKASSFKPMYTGKQMDESTGLYYFNARWYDPGQGRFITQDPIRDGVNWWIYCGNNALVNVDPSGMTTLDDFYALKITNAGTQEEKNIYIQQQTQSWTKNQGLSEYGKIIEKYHDFGEIIFTENNPLNQNELDKILGYNKKIGKSTSCMLSAMINAYASLFRSGITGLQIINALFDVNGNIMDYIGQEMNSKGEYSFYCVNLWNFSYALANSMDARAKDFVGYSGSEGETKSFLGTSSVKEYGLNYAYFSPNEFQNMISMSMSERRGKYTISG